MKFLKSNLAFYFLLTLIILIGSFFRFYNLNWDQGYFFHPDERNIAAAVSRIRFFNQLNPQFFAYGSFSIYLYRALGELLVAITQNSNWVYSWSHINLIGRYLSALLGSVSIFLVYLVTKKNWNPKTAILASFIFAFSPSLIQTAHFGVTETMLVFWLLLILILSLNFSQSPNFKNYLKTGFVLGLATATKISTLSFAVIPITAHFLYHLKYLKRCLKLFILFLIGFLTFSLFSPYVYLDHQKFLESMRYEIGVSTGKLKVCYTLQFEKTLPYLFQIKNFFWQMGPVAFLGLLGAVLLLILGLKNRNRKILLLLAFPITYFLYVGSWHTKFIRYMIPVLPFLAIFAAWVLLAIFKRWKTMGVILIGLTCLITFFWSLAFFSIYTRKSTRITASKWIYQNIPQRAKILQEHWDDGLPISVNGRQSSKYKTEQLTIYEPDNEVKIRYYAEKLAEADYIIISSRRLYGTLIHLPEKYPITSRYYQLLFAGQLGYQKIIEFSSYPTLFGFTINDDKSEETFQVYDHPKVLIFKNINRFTKEKLIQRLKW